VIAAASERCHRRRVTTPGPAHKKGVQLASPVKVGKGRDKRYGMLLASADRLQLITGRGVEFDVARSELDDAKAADSMPRITFGLRGEQHRLALVAGRPSHDGSGLVAGMKAQPHYAQQASAVPRWNDWLYPRSPEQLAQIERKRQEAERGQRFFADEQADAGLVQGPVWTEEDGRLHQLQLIADQFVLTDISGSEMRLGPAGSYSVSWTGKGSGTVLQLHGGGRQLRLVFAPPKLKSSGYDGTGGDTDGIGLVVLLPLFAYFSVSDRRRVKQRIARWRSALPGAVA